MLHNGTREKLTRHERERQSGVALLSAFTTFAISALGEVQVIEAVQVGARAREGHRGCPESGRGQTGREPRPSSARRGPGRSSS